MHGIFISDIRQAFCMTSYHFNENTQVIFDQLVIHVRTNKTFEELMVF